MKNLIRNGGFERGTIDFWTAFDEKSFAVDVATPYKGTYAGKLVADGANKPYVMINDYIPVQIGDMFYFETWLRANGVYPAILYAVYYDEALTEVDTTMVGVSNPGVGSYTQKLWAITGIEGAMYVKPTLFLDHITVDDYMLIDATLMYKFNPEDVIGGARPLIREENIVAAGTLYSDFFLVAPFKEAEFKLDVDDCLGAAETLDVTIQSWGNFGSVPHDIATFEQVTASSDLQTIVINEGLGTKIRVKAVVGGAPTDIDFYVTAIFKR